jgi:hypothetical protein
MRFTWIALILIYPTSPGADDAEISKLLKAKGAEVIESKGVATCLGR